MSKQTKHQDWCASLTQMLTSNPPKPAPCNCGSSEKPQWAGLTDEDVSLLDWESFKSKKECVQAIEAALREKNT